MAFSTAFVTCCVLCSDMGCSFDAGEPPWPVSLVHCNITHRDWLSRLKCCTAPSSRRAEPHPQALVERPASRRGQQGDELIGPLDLRRMPPLGQDQQLAGS